jgi:DNA-binding NarL/FixJ family response regulator
MEIRALVADDHKLFRQAVRAILERDGITVIAEAGDGREAVKLADQFRPEIVVIDIHIALLNGIDATKQILKTSTVTKIILLAREISSGQVREALHTGVGGIVLKTAPACELTQAIRTVCRGIVYLDSATRRVLSEVDAEGVSDEANPLTLREREVLQLICEGKTVKEIAALLDIGQKTAESHRQRIMTKLKVTQTAELVLYAVRCGMIRACVGVILCEMIPIS